MHSRPAGMGKNSLFVGRGVSPTVRADETWETRSALLSSLLSANPSVHRMGYRTLRECVDDLAAAGQLIRIEEPVERQP